ncbi:MAG TPA: hypothetical protein PLM79_02585 [Syntrophobacteraceae bacterium]|nr:hypothetical protein [Syntrophobacteraceae bacterium]
MKSTKKSELELAPEENRELEMIWDRLSVQNPRGATLHSCLQSMREMLTGREKLVAALIDRLSKRPTEVSFRAFRTLEDLVEDKKYRRLIKQAGYRFGQKGYPSAQPAPEEKTVVLIPKEERKAVAHLVSGEEVFLLVSALVPEAGSSLWPLAISAYAEENFAGLSVHVTESSNRAYREYIQMLTEASDFKPAEIPIWHAARLFMEMAEYCGERGRTPEADTAKRLFQPFFEPERKPYAYSLMADVENPERFLNGIDVMGLLEKVPYSWLFFPQKDLQPYWQRILDLERPVLVVPNEIQYQRTLEMVGKAAEEICTGALRRFYQRFFEEQALWFKLSDREEPARSCWVVARHLAGTGSAGDNPVVRQMVILSMGHYWPEEFEKADQAGEKGEKAEPFYLSESGLILPR